MLLQNSAAFSVQNVYSGSKKITFLATAKIDSGASRSLFPLRILNKIALKENLRIRDNKMYGKCTRVDKITLEIGVFGQFKKVYVTIDLNRERIRGEYGWCLYALAHNFDYTTIILGTNQDFAIDYKGGWRYLDYYSAESTSDLVGSTGTF